MKSSARGVKLVSVDDLFSTEESRQDAAKEKVTEIPLTELFPFPDHPFSVRDDDRIFNIISKIFGNYSVGYVVFLQKIKHNMLYTRSIATPASIETRLYVYRLDGK